MDISNSMNEPFGGGTKFDLMHEVARLLAEALDDGATVGLTVFGTGPDCDAVDILLPPTPHAASHVRRMVGALRANPLGNTPLTSALEHAIRSAGKTRAVTVLLLSDGGEGCGRDPVRMLLGLRKEGYSFQIHVLTFERVYGPRRLMASVAAAGRGRLAQFRPDDDRDDMRRRIEPVLGTPGLLSGPAARGAP